MFEELNQRRQAVIDNINKAFETEPIEQLDDVEKAVMDEISKARLEGDLFFHQGKTYVWAKTKPGSTTPYAWHVVQKQTPVVRGKGYNGSHGSAALKKIYAIHDSQKDDVDKMLLKRTPNGHWRLYYDGQDTGDTIAGDIVTESELQSENVCYQDKRVVDNFNLVDNYMEFNNPDDVYFVQIIKRWKDNKDKPGAEDWKAQGKAQGTYHSGAEYLSYYLIHSQAELDALKPDIIKACTYNNARAYISINSRSQNQVNQYIGKFKSRFAPNDPRYMHAEAILYGMAKTGPAWRNERLKVLLDIDTTRDATTKMPDGTVVNIWNETRKRLNNYGIKIAAEYETPSGGLHLILNNKNNRNLKPFYAGLKDFDGGRNLDRLATVHPSEDIKMVLYSNVDTAGY